MGATRTSEERARDVRRLLDAAASLVRTRTRTRAANGLVDSIQRATGLSRENVELGLTRHLETRATDAELGAFVAHAGDAESVHVILSANVFVAPLRAIALARAASTRVTVRPSTRDPAFARALIAEAGDPAITLAEDVRPEMVVSGQVHVYGRDETIAAVRASARPGVEVRGHGTGMGVALVSSSASLAVAAASIADDVVPFDQRGCLSPRVVVVIGGAPRARAFAESLTASLDDLGARVPRGVLGPDEREAAARYTDALVFAGDALRGCSSTVGVAGDVVIPPAGRHVHVVWAGSESRAHALLLPYARFIAAAAADDSNLLAVAAPSHARRSALGAMQRPPLDGPVDLR